MFSSSTNSGYITTYLVVILGSVFLALNLVNTGSVLSNASFVKHILYKEQLDYLIDSCVELALLDLYNNQVSNQTGSYSLEKGGDCDYEIKKDGDKFIINASGQLESLGDVKSMNVKVEINGRLNILSWQNEDI